MHYGLCESSESDKYLKALNIVISVKQIISKSNNSKCAVAYLVVQMVDCKPYVTGSIPTQFLLWNVFFLQNWRDLHWTFVEKKFQQTWSMEASPYQLD